MNTERFEELNNVSEREHGRESKEGYIEIMSLSAIGEFYKIISKDAPLNDFKKLFPSIDETTALELKEKFTHVSRRTRAVIYGAEDRRSEDRIYDLFYNLKLYEQSLRVKHIKDQIESLFENKGHKNLDFSFSPVDVYADIALTKNPSHVFSSLYSADFQKMESLTDALFVKPRSENDVRMFIEGIQELEPIPGLNLGDQVRYPRLGARAMEASDISHLIDYLDIRDLMEGIFLSDLEERSFDLQGNKLIFRGYKDGGSNFTSTFSGNYESDFKQLYNTEYRPDPSTLGLAGTLATMKSKGVKFDVSLEKGNLIVEIL